MGGDFLPLADEEEADLDEDSREILRALRHLCSEDASGLRTDQALAAREERHLRLHLQRGPNDWVDLLVGDGYTEFTRSGEKTYEGYLTPEETVAGVREWMLG
jgi:hypothetical protein